LNQHQQKNAENRSVEAGKIGGANEAASVRIEMVVVG
jgi:hypothetical protein